MLDIQYQCFTQSLFQLCTSIFTQADLKEKKPDFSTLLLCNFAFNLKARIPEELSQMSRISYELCKGLVHDFTGVF